MYFFVFLKFCCIYQSLAAYAALMPSCLCWQIDFMKIELIRKIASTIGLHVNACVVSKNSSQRQRTRTLRIDCVNDSSGVICAHLIVRMCPIQFHKIHIPMVMTSESYEHTLCETIINRKIDFYSINVVVIQTIFYL